MKVAVTGANGHLGANVVRALLGAQHEVIAVVRDSSNCKSLNDLDVQLRRAEATNANDVTRALQGASHVINLAAVISIDGDPDGLVSKTNVMGPQVVADACLKLRARMVHVSSIHAFSSDPDRPALDETADRPSADAFSYDRSKYLGEQAVREKITAGLDAVILNPTGIIGPYDYGSSYAGKMLSQMFNSNLPALVDGGFDWVDARDVAASCVAALTRGATGENYILSGKFATMKELAGLCERVSGKPGPRISFPIWVAALGLPILAAWCRLTASPPLYTRESLKALQDANRNVSSKKASEALGHSARPLPLTLADCYEWYRRF
ncbi:MAG: NAD-dependent epimerase/dehydratase family protein [Alphaproteobacteria bacterium]|nr:NAD-dependent epimerase/dehydratase family protein [Alphaproteobacteria bacterium]